jgi:hypothetical protein
VATYEETDEKHRVRAEILDETIDRLQHVLIDPECGRVVVVGHSLGTSTATFHSVDDGVFGFTVEMCDPIPTQCATGKRQATVNNVASNITNIDDPEGEVDTPVTLEVTFEDPGLADAFDATVDLNITDNVEPQSWADVGIPTGNPGSAPCRPRQATVPPSAPSPARCASPTATAVRTATGSPSRHHHRRPPSR